MSPPSAPSPPSNTVDGDSSGGEVASGDGLAGEVSSGSFAEAGGGITSLSGRRRQLSQGERLIVASYTLVDGQGNATEKPKSKSRLSRQVWPHHPRLHRTELHFSPQLPNIPKRMVKRFACTLAPDSAAARGPETLAKTRLKILPGLGRVRCSKPLRLSRPSPA